MSKSIYMFKWPIANHLNLNWNLSRSVQVECRIVFSNALQCKLALTLSGLIWTGPDSISANILITIAQGYLEPLIETKWTTCNIHKN